MRGYDMISELYRGNLRPCDRRFCHDTPFAAAMDTLAAQEEWFRKHLTGESVDRFHELMTCHSEILDTMSCENFRTGFQYGVMMVMESVSDSVTALSEL